GPRDQRRAELGPDRLPGLVRRIHGGHPQGRRGDGVGRVRGGEIGVDGPRRPPVGSAGLVDGTTSARCHLSMNAIDPRPTQGPGAGRKAMLFAALVFSALAACKQVSLTGAGEAVGADGSIFREDFESGALAAWQDGVDPSRHRIVTDPTAAQSGSRYLDVTYPAGPDGGWLTHFLLPRYDSLYVRFSVRFPAKSLGGTTLAA